MGFMNWLTGRDSKESDLYVDFDKVESVTTRLKEISTSSVSEGFQSITNALEKLNSTPGMDLIGGANPSFSVAEVFESISSEIEQINTSIQTKADDAKVYSEASDLERVGSSAAMILAKAGEGFLSVFEDIGDGVVSVVGWLAPKDSGLEKACEEFVKRDIAHDTFNFYYDSEFAKKSAITEDSFISKAAKFGGQMGGFILLGAGISKATKVFAASTNPLLQSTAQFASSLKKIGTAEAALMGMGTGTEEALQKGKTMDQAALKGLGRAAIQGAIAWGIGTLAEKAALKKTKASEVFQEQGDDTLRAAASEQGDDTLRAFSDQIDDEATTLSNSRKVFTSDPNAPSYRGTDLRDGTIYISENGETYYLSGQVKSPITGQPEGAVKHIAQDIKNSTESVYNNDAVRRLLEEADQISPGSFTKDISNLNGNPVLSAGKKGSWQDTIDRAYDLIRSTKGEQALSQYDDDLIVRMIKPGKVQELAAQSGLEIPSNLAGKTGALTSEEVRQVEQFASDASHKIYGQVIENYERGIILVDGKTTQVAGDLTGIPVRINGAAEGARPYVVEILTRPPHGATENAATVIKHMVYKSDKAFVQGISVDDAVLNQAERAINISVQGKGSQRFVENIISSTPSGGETTSQFVRRFTDGMIDHITNPAGELYIADSHYQQSAIQYIEEKILGATADQSIIQKILSFLT